MAASPISIKLRCASWKQLAAIYERDLARNAVFLKSAAPPPVGTRVRINLTLPTQTLIVLNGAVERHVGAGELNGRGPGVDIKLQNVPQSAMWLIESALESARQKGALPAAAANKPAAQADSAAGAQPPAQDQAQAQEELDIAAGDKLVAAEGDLLAALTQELASLRKLNPFQILGVGYETDDDQVRAAFGSLTKRYHPDRFARYQSGEARKVAAEIFILIRNAYQHLDTADKRAKAVEILNKKRRAAKQAAAMSVNPAKPPPVPAKPPPVPAKPPPVPAAKPPPVPAAKPPATAQATAGPGSAQSPAAPSAPEMTAPDQADGASASPQDDLTRAYAQLDAGHLDEALSIFRLASRRSPSDRGARIGVELVEGLKALADRDRLEAAQRFEAVLEMDPDNERAARELAEMRRQATNERKSLLSRMLNQKE